MIKRIWIISFLIVGVFLGIFFLKGDNSTNNENIKSNTSLEITKAIEKTYPIAEFEKRITKKKFGDYINPQNSPVQPERFSGWHTGVDVEYENVDNDVPVFAVCNGETALKRWVSGYGGTIVLKCQIENSDYYVVYGHLDINSFTKKTEVIKGEKLAILGDGFTQETDFERKHLHFGIHKNSLDLKGYVQMKNELNNWINPATTKLFY